VIPESFIQELLHRIDIVDLIDGYVPLKKAGANYAACCPFHNEKSPSFTVSPTKQFYHCFGCGAQGTAIGFVMEYSGQGFVDTIKELSSRAGLQMPEQEARARNDGPKTVALVEVMARASKYYREQLKSSEKAVAYLKKRGLTGEIAAKFGIGYAPDGWQNLESAFADYSAAELQSAGLVIKNEQGRLYDRFRDRVMFPIISQKGEVIAFGGRVLDVGEPKYLNSPETPLFEKGRELFGLPQARQALREKNVAVVVEGYMDVVALAQHGVGNAVATLGTATTTMHMQKLLRQVDRVVFCFDGDAAGRKAAWRALENSLEALADDKNIGFILLPATEDPDSYVRQHGAGAFETLVLQATPLSDFLLRELAAQCDMTTAEGRARLVHEAKPLLTRLTTPMLRLQLVKRLAEASGFSQPEVERLCELKSVAPAAPRRVPRAKHSLTRTVIRLVLQKPALAARLPLELVADDGAEGSALRYLCRLVGDADSELPTAAVLERLRGGEHEALMRGAVAELMQEPFAEDEVEAEFCGALAQFELRAIDSRLESFKQRAGQLSAEEKQDYLRLLQEKGRLRRPSAPE
jgi:DNA primase